MRMYDLITEKKAGRALKDEDIRAFIEGYTSGEIPDYQAAALAMAICLRGMNKDETVALTKAMAESGDMLDLSRFGTLTVDKHSTGGVGDKTTLIVAPIAAAIGCKVAKMSGRGLGHTGGTVDKLEAFPGLKTDLTAEEFFAQVEEVGVAVVGQSADLAPADKKLYALRDVTATVDSIPLITSSIMSKKLAAGSHSIVLDVKCGSGSFMKSVEDAERLARNMVEIGCAAGRRTRAVITNMDIPLGRAVGNSLEIKEAVSVLRGGGPEDLRAVAVELSVNMAMLSLDIPRGEAEARVEEAISSGAAMAKFTEWIIAQGGERKYAEQPELLPISESCVRVYAKRDGYVTAMNAETVGIASVTLGAGREKKGDSIDFGAGIVLLAKRGDKVRCGDLLAELYAREGVDTERAERMIGEAIVIEDTPPSDLPLIYGVIE